MYFYVDEDSLVVMSISTVVLLSWDFLVGKSEGLILKLKKILVEKLECVVTFVM